MRYTKHFSSIIKSEGAPNLTTQSFGVIMNIIYLEGAISSLELVKLKNRNPNTSNRYDIWLKKYRTKLDAITHDLSPEELLKILTGTMLEISK